MKRSHLLLLVVFVIFAGATALRVRTHLARTRQAVIGNDRTAPQPVALPGPHDYVAEPQVWPDEVNHGPGRIISLAPSITEVICALGLRDRLVGRTQYCRYIPDVESVPEVGALMDTNFELIRAAGPDLVLTTANSGPVIDRLRELGLRQESVPHDSLEDVYAAIERIGQLCDRPRTAGALVAAIRADIRSLASAAGAVQTRPLNVLVVEGELPVPPRAVWVAGSGSFLDAFIRLAGHRNAAATAMSVSHGELPLEKLPALDPDAILTFGQEPTREQWNDLYQSWSIVGPIRAIRDRRVRCVGGKEWLSAGPRVAIEFHHFIAALSEFR